MPDKVLSKQQLEQLDSNIRKMVDSGLGDEDIMSYAKEFKSKYGAESGPVPTKQITPVGLPTFQEQQATLQQVQSKYDKAVQDDRSKAGKLAATVYNGIIGAGESLLGFGAEAFSELAQRIPTPATDFGGNKLVGGGIYELTPEEQKQARVELKKSVKAGGDVLRSGYVTREEEKQLQGKFDITNGLGLDDFAGLTAMSGRIAGDIGLAAVTGGTSYFMQGYSDGVDEFDEAAKEMGVEGSDAARSLYGASVGTINGLLEKYAINKLVGDGPVFKSIQRKVVADALKQTARNPGKEALKLIENLAENQIKKLTTTAKAKGMKAAYRSLVEGGTEAAQAALQDGVKLAINAFDGSNVFNEKEVKGQFFNNLLNSAVAGSVYGPIIGFGMDKTFGANVNKELLKDVANAKTEEDFQKINEELATTFDKYNFSDAERQMVMDNAKRYAQIKQTLPAGTSELSQEIAIPKIEERIKLDEEIKKQEESLNTVDEAVKPSMLQQVELLKDKRASINDEIAEAVSGIKYNYIEDNGKFFKETGEGQREEISKNRYDLEQIKLEGYATTKGQGPIQEVGTAGDISKRAGTQERGTQEAATKTDSRYRNISSEKTVGIPTLLGSKVTYKLPNRKITGTLIQEGKTLSVEDENGDVVAELGNIDELSNMSPEEMNLTVIESKVEPTERGFAVDGKELFNENDNPFDAVSIDQNGNVMNVVLITAGGKRRKFRGRVAQDLATQISAKEDAKAAQADERLQQEMALPTPQAPIVITTEPAIAKVTEDNLDTIDTVQGTPVQKKVLGDIKPVVRAIAAAVKSITGSPVSVNIHNQESFGKAVEEAGGTAEESTSRGFYMASDGSIHLNMDNIDSDTMLHEGFHPILDALQKFNPSVINELFTKLESIPEAAQIIANARENYDGEITQKKEAITDFVAGVADGRIILNPSNFQKIKAFILDMLNKIGLGVGSPQLIKVDNEVELVKLATFITEKFTTGEQITIENLDSLLFGENQYNSSDGIDVDIKVSDNGSGVKPQFSKNTLQAARDNVKSIKDFIGTQISRVVFYDITRVGKLTIKNIKTGYTPDIDGKGGPMYSYMDNSLKNKAVLAFVSINQAIQSLQRQQLYPQGVHAIASQNPLTAHLGNKTTLNALFGDGIGIFQNAAKTKAQEKEIVQVLVSELDRMSKMPITAEASKAINSILQKVKLSDIKTIADFRDKIMLGEGDSFGKRGAILTELLQNKQSKVTAATRDSHKILHYKYGIPTIADIAIGNNQEELSNVELGDVMKFVKPSTEPVIYTTDKESFDRYSKNPTPEMKKGGIRIELLPESDAHESYPFILAGENVGLLDEYIGAQQLFERFKGIKKSQTFFKIGRMKKYAEAGIVSQEVTGEQKGPAFQKAKEKADTKIKSQTRDILKVGKRFLKDQFSVGGILGKDIMKLSENMRGELSAEVSKAEELSKKAMDTMSKYAGAISKKDIEDFLTGQPNSDRKIPMDLASVLNDMRAHVDTLTDRMIDLGIVDDPEEIAKYQANKGKYLLRSYELFDKTATPVEKILLGKSTTDINIDNVKNRLKNVDQSVVDKALKFLSKEFLRADPTLTEEQAMKMARREANKILGDDSSAFAPKKYIGSTNVRSLNERLDIAPEIRALMGEYKDPVYNYYASIFKLAGLTSNRKFLNDLREDGLGKYLFTEENAPENASTRISTENSLVLKPLAGLYTYPEIKEALEKQEEVHRWTITKMLGFLRKLKTVYNPATHAMNIFGNLGFVAANGHWNFIDKAWTMAKKNPDAYKELIDTLNRNSVLNNSVGMGELKQYFDRFENVDDFLKNIFDEANKKTTTGKTLEQIQRIKRTAKSVPKVMEKAYQWEDDIFKILAFINESNRYANAEYKKPYAELNAKEKANIDSIASDIVKDTYPTFSRTPKFVKSLSKAMFLGNFLAFPVESVRTSYNILKLARKEVMSGNPTLVKVGISRIAGTLAYNSLFDYMIAHFAMAAGSGIGGALGSLFDDEKEKEKNEDIRKYVAPWNKNSKVLPLQADNGKLVYMDIGRLDAFGYQKKIWDAFWNNLNDEKGFYESVYKSMAEGISPFFDFDFAFQTFMDFKDNNDGFGNDIYNPEANPEQRTKQKLLYLTKKLSPGAVNSLIKMHGFYNEGDTEKMQREVLSNVFTRTYDVDIEQQFRRYINAKASDGGNSVDVGFRERLDNAEKIYTSVKYDKTATQQEKDAAYKQAIDRYKSILSDISKYYQSALRFGVPSENIDNLLFRAKLGEKRGLPVLYAIKKGVAEDPDEMYIRK